MTDYCAICGNKLHEQDIFPKDYPNKWKMCCTCLGLAEKFYAHHWVDGLWLEDKIKIFEAFLSL